MTENKLPSWNAAFPGGLTRANMRRYLPYAIIGIVFALSVIAGVLFFRFRHPPIVRGTTANGKPGAEPAHIRGLATAPVALEEFGDFECMPCFLLWPALRNLEHDYGDRLAVTFRQHPMIEHRRAPDAARASEAAGLQGRFWEMHDLLYLSRSQWARADDPRAVFSVFAGRLGLDVDRFKKDMDSAEVAQRIKADWDRGESLRVDRTPEVFVNGQRAELQSDVEQGLRADIDAALDPSKAPKN
jgi:protein-disulfide isomerase